MPHLLLEAGHDQQRVVDAHGKAQHHDHHGYEEDQLELLPDDRHRRQRDDDRYSRKSQRKQRGDHGSKEHQQHQQRHRDAEPLTLLQVLFRQLVVLESGARVPSYEHDEVVRFVRLLHHVEHVLDVGGGLLGRAGQGVVHQHGFLVGGDEERE